MAKLSEAYPYSFDGLLYHCDVDILKRDKLQ